MTLLQLLNITNKQTKKKKKEREKNHFCPQKAKTPMLGL